VKVTKAVMLNGIGTTRVCKGMKDAAAQSKLSQERVHKLFNTFLLPFLLLAETLLQTCGDIVLN
jgi:hypothetical protein